VNGQSQIWVIDSATNEALHLTNGPGSASCPSWSRDGKFIYFSSDRTGRGQVWKMPSAGGEAKQITRDGGWYSVEAFDGRTIYFATALYPAPNHPVAIRAVPADGGAETTIIENAVGASALAIAPDGLYYLSSLTGSRALLDFYDFAAQSSRRIATIDHPVHHVLSSTPDGRSVVFTQIDREDSDLMLLPGK
jgi:Tol biopolymer transport system component